MDITEPKRGVIIHLIANLAEQQVLGKLLPARRVIMATGLVDDLPFNIVKISG